MALTIVSDTLPKFPTDLSFERPGYTRYMTDVVILDSGAEQRNRFWKVPRKRMDVGYGVREIVKIETLLDFFDCCYGRWQPFRIRDWAEYKSCSITATAAFDDQSLGTATAGQTAFQLKKTKTLGSYSMDYDIIKPDGPTVKIGVDNVEETSGWTVDETTGIITRGVALAGGEEITWGGEFFYKARFDTDEIARDFAAWEAGSIEVPVIMLRA
jgi:uncharacterized protein (TIGR02217 family)